MALENTPEPEVGDNMFTGVDAEPMMETVDDSGLASIDLPESSTSEIITEPVPVVEKEQAPAKTYSKVTEESPVFSPLKGEWDPEAETLAVPTGSYTEVNAVIEALPNIGIVDGPSGRLWGETLAESFTSIPERGIFGSTVERSDSEYTHAPRNDNGELLTAAVPNFKFNIGEKVSGERAVMRVRSLMGLGTIVQVPLWHSGFWITIKAPSEASLLELQRRLIESKINLGRETHGLAYANTSVFIVGWLMDFVLAHIYDTTIRDKNVNLREWILSTDIMALVWGLSTTIWPNGFQYTRACINDPEKCNHVVKEKINLGKLLWVDRPSLTKRQLAHMSSRGGSTMSLEAIKNYREDFLRGRSRVATFGTNDQIKITFDVPTIGQYVNSGHKWVNNIVAMVSSSFAEEVGEGRRDFYITELGKSTSMRQYAHWISSVDSGGMLTEDSESIDLIVDTLSSDDIIRKKFFEEVIKFIDDSTIALVAVPSYVCPKCEMLQEQMKAEKFKHLLPIDAVATFFTLVVPKLQKIANR